MFEWVGVRECDEIGSERVKTKNVNLSISFFGLWDKQIYSGEDFPQNIK